MSKTCRFFTTSLIALTLGAVSTAQAGFDQGQNITGGLGPNAGAYSNPYLSTPNQAAAQQLQAAQGLPAGGLGIQLPGISANFGGFNLGPIGFSSPFAGFNLGPIGVSSPFGGFNLGPVGFSSPLGGFGFHSPGASGGVSTPFGGFGVAAPIACFVAPCGGFSLGPVGVSSPWGGLGFHVPGASGGISTPFGGLNLGPVGASSPWGGFGFLPPWSWKSGGLNLGQPSFQPNAMPMPYNPYGYPVQGYFPQPAAAAPGVTAVRQPQSVFCTINEVSLITRSVSDCEKAGGESVASNAR
jgi:hypothetical protein